MDNLGKQRDKDIKKPKRNIILAASTLALFITGCGASGYNIKPEMVQETEPKTVQGAEETGDSLEGTASWSANYYQLENLYTLALATEHNIYGCYAKDDEILLDSINKENLSIKKSIVLNDASLISGMSADQEGNVYILDNREENIDIWKLDATDTIRKYAGIRLEDTESADDLFIKGIYTDSCGNLYLWCEMTVPVIKMIEGTESEVWHWEDRVYVKDRQFNTLFYEGIANVSGTEVLNFQITADGTPLFIIKDREGVYIQGIDIDNHGKKEPLRLTEATDIFDEDSPESIVSTDNGFLYCQNKQETQNVFKLSSYGIRSNDIMFLTKYKDTYEIIDNHGDTGHSEFISFTFCESEKTIVTMGATMAAQDLEGAVSEFNRYNDRYRVEIVDYFGQAGNYEDAAERLKLDVVTGKAPDIISVSGIDYSMFAKKGVFADLYSFMQEDEDCSQDMLMPSVVRAYEDAGHLYSIAPAFQLHSMWGYADVTEGYSGVTFEELLQILEDNGKNFNAIAGFSADEPVLTRLCTVAMDEFVDWENGICEFDGDYFKKILSFAKEYTGNYTGGTFSERIKSKEILMSIGLISSVSNYQIQKELYGGKVAFIGYPVAEGTGTAVAFRGSAVAVNAQTENQAGAWAFIKYYLLQGYDGQGFPVIKEQFDQVLEAAMKEDYIGTENGGSERNPKEHYNDGSGDIFVYAATPEDVDIIRKLVDSAENRFEPHSEIQSIINEEAEAYFTGQVDLDRTVEKIQNRVTLLLQE